MSSQSRRRSDHVSRRDETRSLTPDPRSETPSPGTPLRSRNDDSWVEVYSRPSSSSLSSADNEPNPDEILTIGLRVSQSAAPTTASRRRQTRSSLHSSPTHHRLFSRPVTVGTSSQEEYDESESEEDHFLSSSNEHILPIPSSRLAPLNQNTTHTYSSSDEEEGANITTLGLTRTNTSVQHETTSQFTPQPNAFSHPPAAATRPIGQRHSSSTGAMNSYSNSRLGRQTRSSSALQAGDHDAALRASLTTLLSCAAAARGLPRRDNTNGMTAGSGIFGGGIGRSNALPAMRMVPESQLLATADNSSSRSPPSASQKEKEGSNCSVGSNTKREDKTKDTTGKRKASLANPKSTSSSKKKRPSSPSSLPGFFCTKSDFDNGTYTILPWAWVVSAGVVVLVSVVGFGAGYVIGREVGRNENLSVVAGNAGNYSDLGVRSSGGGCGREVLNSSVVGSSGGLRKWRWASGGVGGRGVAA